MYKVEIKQRAQSHLKKAALWYNKQQQGLGLRFLDEVEDAFDVLSINPFYAVRYKEIRGFNLKKFPFLLLYKVDEKVSSVTILAVFHTSKDPAKYPQ